MKKAIVIAAMALGLCGCVQTTPIMNSINTDKIDFSKVDDFKEGRDCSYYILGLFGPVGDAKLTSAVKHAGVKKVYVMDKSSEYFILFGRQCIRVYGE